MNENTTTIVIDVRDILADITKTAVSDEVIWSIEEDELLKMSAEDFEEIEDEYDKYYEGEGQVIKSMAQSEGFYNGVPPVKTFYCECQKIVQNNNAKIVLLVDDRLPLKSEFMGWIDNWIGKGYLKLFHSDLNTKTVKCDYIISSRKDILKMFDCDKKYLHSLKHQEIEDSSGYLVIDSFDEFLKDIEKTLDLTSILRYDKKVK